jgi:hypothetical protein
MKLDEIRSFSLSLPKTTEQPHFDLSSFRIRGKIFATITADERHVHVFVDEEDRERAIAIDAANFEKLWWGKKVMGLRVHYHQADPTVVKELLYRGWCKKAPKRLAAAFELPPP